tara:strand:- start:4332 stop:4658 length:327 start_codon:yes stop_codon:yes gene_type:complete
MPYASGLLDSTGFSQSEWPGHASFLLTERLRESGFNVKSMYSQIPGSGLNFNVSEYPDLPAGYGVDYLVSSLRKNISHSIQSENSGVLSTTSYSLLFPGQDYGSGVRY